MDMLWATHTMHFTVTPRRLPLVRTGRGGLRNTDMDPVATAMS